MREESHMLLALVALALFAGMVAMLTPGGHAAKVEMNAADSIGVLAVAAGLWLLLKAARCLARISATPTLPPEGGWVWSDNYQDPKEEPRMQQLKQQRRQRGAALLIMIFVIAVILLANAASKTDTGMNLWKSICSLGKTPKDYHSPEADKNFRGGDDPGYFGPGEQSRLEKRR